MTDDDDVMFCVPFMSINVLLLSPIFNFHKFSAAHAFINVILAFRNLGRLQLQ
jgi:hypothetical protein